VSPNVAWSGSLESYHPYLQAKKVSKIQKIECIHSGLPKIAKSHFGCLFQNCQLECGELEAISLGVSLRLVTPSL
jgi:hypothetical protein